jgi:hypothetical protein
VHVCGSRSAWERDHLLFRDYLRAHPAACESYTALKRKLIARWQYDRLAYGEAKTGFVLDTLTEANQWAALAGWLLWPNLTEPRSRTSPAGDLAPPRSSAVPGRVEACLAEVPPPPEERTNRKEVRHDTGLTSTSGNWSAQRC